MKEILEKIAIVIVFFCVMGLVLTFLWRWTEDNSYDPSVHSKSVQTYGNPLCFAADDPIGCLVMSQEIRRGAK